MSPDDPAIALVPAGVFEPAGISRVGDDVGAGRFQGAALFLDISGFTTLSERLGRAGSAGTEELVRILNGFFGPAIDLVHEAGGEVVAFGGDAITAVWAGDDAREAALACGERLVDLSERQGRIDSSIGRTEVAVRIGIASGTVEVAVDGSEERSVVLTHGAAIDGAVANEHGAGLNRIVVDDPDPVPTPPTPGDGGSARGDEPGTSPDPSRFAHPVTVERVRRRDTTLIDGHRRVTTIFVQFPTETDGAAVASRDPIRTVVEVAGSLGGEVIQITGGDKGTVALVTFGAPTSSDDDACRAVAMAGATIEQIPGASVGIGTGTVFAGLLGGPPRRVYTVIGDAVNLAARLMQHAEPGTVVVDETTAAMTETVFAFGERTSIEVKGKAGSVTVRTLEGQRGRVWPANRLATDGPLVGRSGELSSAERALEPRDAGIVRVLLRGAPGIGKSRLARALAERATARGWQVAAGGFAAFGDRAPYAGWQPILRSVLGERDDLPAAVSDLLPDSTDLAPLLGPVLGLELPDTGRTAGLDGELRSELGDELSVRLIVAAAHRRPLLIELEDWHWADPSSIRLMEALASHPSTAPVTIAVTQRFPSEAAELVPNVDDIVIDLAEFDEATTHELAASVLARTGTEADDHTLERIVALGAGNPLMIETLIDVGEGTVLATGLAPLLQARLDRLPDAELRLLLWASAFGRPVLAEELERAMEEEQEVHGDILANLDRAVSGGLLTAVRGTDGAPIEFRHASVREAAYERLSHDSRRRVHHGVALMLEERAGQAIEIAGHLTLTDDVPRQRRWFPSAATQARAAWAVDEAISWFEQARSIGDDSDEVRISLAELVMVRGDLEQVATLVDAPCLDPASDQRRLMLLGERAMITGANEEAVAILRDALDPAPRAHPAGPESCAAGELLSRALLEVGRFDDAMAVSRRIVDEVDPSDHDTMARAIGSYGTVQIMRYDLAGAVDTLRRAVDEALRGEDRVRLVHLRSDLASAYAMSGDVAASLEAMLAAREVAQAIGYRRHLALSVSNEAELRLLLGDGEAVTKLSLRGLHAAVALGDIGLASDDLLRLSANPWLEVADRRAIIEPSIRLEADLGRPHTMIEFRTVSLEIAAQEPTGLSITEAKSVLADARDLGRPDLELRVLSALGARADPDTLVDLRGRLEDADDRFLVDVEMRRITGDRGDDEALRSQGRALYRRAPFASYRAALAELGVADPVTDVEMPAMLEDGSDVTYSLDGVLRLIGTLRERREAQSSISPALEGSNPQPST